MAQRAPGKHYRKGISLIDGVKKFDTEEKAEGWFVAQRWPNGVACVRCGSVDVAKVASRKPQPFRCRDCRKSFSVKVGTLLHNSPIPLSKWAIAFYLYSTSLKSVASMKLRRDLGLTQKSAWYMGHRIRRMWDGNAERFAGPTEVDETYIGGLEKNKHKSRRLNVGAGAGGKAVVVAVKDRATNQIKGSAAPHQSNLSLRTFVERNVQAGSLVYSDEHRAYRHFLNLGHETVSHSAKEYVRGMAHVNGVESFWALLKRGYHGTFHHVSEKHLGRYVAEFSGRHNSRRMDTADQMADLAKRSAGKRLPYAELIGPEETRQPRMI